jgi:RNA polymerase sigma factor (sigma-70 family)
MTATPSDSARSGARPEDPSNVTPLRPAARRIAAAPTDAELLGRCRGRDPDAWAQLTDRYERLIYSVALRNGVTAEDAADITQTTFITLIDSLDRIRDDEKLASWLMTVARRQAWRLRNTSRRTVPLEVAPEPAADPLEDWATLTTLQDALSTLGGTCRELLLALYFDPQEPSYAEIAERFGRAIGGIGPLRGRCLERLRDIMTEEQG